MKSQMVSTGKRECRHKERDPLGIGMVEEVISLTNWCNARSLKISRIVTSGK